jgi:hypothetical protein
MVSRLKLYNSNNNKKTIALLIVITTVVVSLTILIFPLQLTIAQQQGKQLKPAVSPDQANLPSSSTSLPDVRELKTL